MEISEVRIKLVEESGERLRAFCSITLDGDFVIRDLKIIDGVSGPFVAMPSRKLADRCPRCGCKNHLRAKYCNDCGLKLNEARAPKDSMGRAKLHADVAHPINAACRERIQTAVVKAYEAEVEKSKSPDYKPPAYDDFGDDDVTHLVEEQARAAAVPPPAKAVEPPPAVEPEEPPAETEAEEPSVVAEGPDEEGAFSDYNSLIADLKREAAGRQDRPERTDRPDSMFTDISGGSPRPERGNERPGEQRGGDRGDRGGQRGGGRGYDRGDRGGREGGRQQGRGEGRGGRGDRPQGRDDRGPRRFDRRDDRRGGPQRDDRRRDRDRDQPQRSGPAPEAGPSEAAPAPMKAPPPPPPPPPAPRPQAEEDDFGAGL